MLEIFTCTLNTFVKVSVQGLYDHENSDYYINFFLNMFVISIQLLPTRQRFSIYRIILAQNQNTHGGLGTANPIIPC